MQAELKTGFSFLNCIKPSKHYKKKEDIIYARFNLLVPTVGNREDPLLVDENPTTEVVAIVQGGHVWTRVRLALLPTNDPAIFMGNCGCHIQI